MNRLRLLPVIVGLALFALSPAPIKDTRSGVRIEPEKSEAQRAAEQTAATMRETGDVPTIDGGEVAPPLEHSSKGEKAMIALEAAQRGRDAIKSATQDVKQGKPSGSNWWKWIAGILVLAGSFGLVQAFKAWANKNLPDAPDFRR